MGVTITLYKISGELVGRYSDVQIIEDVWVENTLCFRYDDNRDGKTYTRTITTTLPYLIVDEYEKPEHIEVP